MGQSSRPAAGSSAGVTALTAAAGLALLAAGFVVALLEPVPHIERLLFETVNGWPGAVSTGLWPIMQLGSVVAAFIVAGACLVVWRRPRPALDVLVAGVAASSLAQVVKALVERGRPAVHLNDVAVRLEGVDGWGFVSGHTAVAFALATALAPHLGPAGRVVGFAVAAAVGLARVTHGVHLPADVVGGAGLGILCGVAARLLFDRLLRDKPAVPRGVSPS